ncbi:MAG: nucleoside kinase, partial [Alistipes sp.]|nr:nucleoside kinase [Alistipes sp.]
MRKKDDTIQVLCENLGRRIEVAAGTTLAQIARRVDGHPRPFLAALVDNRIRELGYRLYDPATVRLVAITAVAGIRVLQ